MQFFVLFFCKKELCKFSFFAFFCSFFFRRLVFRILLVFFRVFCWFCLLFYVLFNFLCFSFVLFFLCNIFRCDFLWFYIFFANICNIPRKTKAQTKWHNQIAIVFCLLCDLIVWFVGRFCLFVCFCASVCLETLVLQTLYYGAKKIHIK